MFNTECKKTVSKIILSFILIMMTLLAGCQKNPTDSAIEFGTIDVSEIDKIELSGTTGGPGHGGQGQGGVDGKRADVQGGPSFPMKT